MASPDPFLPELPDWRENSQEVVHFGSIDVGHSDLRAQALAKIAGGHERDIVDVQAVLDRDLVSRAALRDAFATMKPRLVRYPRLDPMKLAERVARLTNEDCT